MDGIFRKYYWLIKLLAGGAIGGLAVAAALKSVGVGKILAPSEQVIDFSKIKVDPEKKKGTVRARSGDKVAKAQVSRQILDVNLFCPTCIPQEAETGDASAPVVPGEIKSRLPLMLLATMESDDPDYSMATILDTESKALSAYVKGDPIRPGVVLDRVERGRVVFKNGEQAEYIEIGGTPPPAPRTATAAAKTVDTGAPSNTTIPGAEDAIKCSDENNCVVDRAFVNKLLANPAALTKEARVVPAIRNGKTQGFKFYGIRPGSLPKLLGIKNGDMVTSVNGHELTGLDQAMGLYAKLRNAGHLSVTIERKGQPVQKEIDIK